MALEELLRVYKHKGSSSSSFKSSTGGNEQGGGNNINNANNRDSLYHKRRRIHHLEIVRKKTIYGMYTQDFIFIKAVLYDPRDILRIAAILEVCCAVVYLLNHKSITSLHLFVLLAVLARNSCNFVFHV